MLSCICLNWVLLVLFTGSTVSESAVIGEVGQNITVPCFYSVQNKNDITTMCWGRDKCPNSKCSQPIIWTDGLRVTERQSSRYQLQGILSEGDVSLTILNARETDSGFYCCRVEIPGPFNDQLINYKVVVNKAPGSTSESSFAVTRTWPSVSASEAPQTSTSVSLPSQQHQEHGLYIGIGACAALLLILSLALLLSKPPTVSVPTVRGIAGQAVTLPCSYPVKRPKDISDMCWGKGPCPNSKCSNKFLDTTGSKVTYRASWRYNLHGRISSGDVSLTIAAVRMEDAGMYCCRVEIPGLFNDIKRNIQLEVVKAPPVTTTITAITTTNAPVSSEDFTETTFAPQATSDVQPTAETAVLLTNSTLPPETTAPEIPAVSTGETSAPPTTAGTENDIFPETVVETSAPPDFPTTSPAADVTTEDVVSYSTLPGSTEGNQHNPFLFLWSRDVATEFPGTLPTAEETTNSDMVEEMAVMEVSANSVGNAGKYEDRGDKFPNSIILIACVTVGSIVFILMISLVWKRKQARKIIVKSLRLCALALSDPHLVTQTRALREPPGMDPTTSLGSPSKPDSAFSEEILPEPSLVQLGAISRPVAAFLGAEPDPH
ncbi:T-cell immunoglobulin and mucin domain-containing protein 4 [Turdus rufiventris]|nr:T-cell immunoglobulin and mucin domain-containing protein 4 [Turdus rufiventris]